MKDTPMIAIYREGATFRVEINGKAIDRMRSFEVKVSNERKIGISEAPFYHVEQYLPRPEISRGDPERERYMMKRLAEQSVETPGSQAQTSF